MKKAARTVLRRCLRSDSELQTKVQDGMRAVKRADRGCFQERVRQQFEDSLYLDDALHAGHERENRWDYLLGHAPSATVVAVEPHPAKQDHISMLIRKRSAAKEHLKSHLEDGACISRWLWVASGEVHFADTEKARRQLDQNGIQFVGKKVMARHLPDGKGPK